MNGQRLFRYRALDAHDQLVTGRRHASDARDLADKLGSRGLRVLRCAPDRLQRPVRTGLSRRQLIGLTLQLEQLLGAGIPPVQALRDLADSRSPGAAQDLLHDLAEQVDGGATLSQAVNRHTSAFGRLYGPMISVGEQSGALPEVLQRLAEMLTWLDQLLGKTRSLLVYPALVALVLLLVIGVMLGYLVPELEDFLAGGGQPVPAHTRTLIATSQWWRDWWPWLLGGAACVGLLLPAALRVSSRLRRSFDAALLRLPPVGPLVLRVQLARFAKSFALTYAAGISVIDGLQLCNEVVSNHALRAALERARSRVVRGEPISTAFARSRLFPRLVIRMLAVGESSGELDKALDKVARFFERDLDAAVQRVEPLLAPVMIMLLAGMVLWIVTAVLGPIYDAVLSLGSL